MGRVKGCVERDELGGERGGARTDLGEGGESLSLVDLDLGRVLIALSRGGGDRGARHDGESGAGVVV